METTTTATPPTTTAATASGGGAVPPPSGSGSPTGVTSAEIPSTTTAVGSAGSGSGGGGGTPTTPAPTAASSSSTTTTATAVIDTVASTVSYHRRPYPDAALKLDEAVRKVLKRLLNSNDFPDQQRINIHKLAEELFKAGKNVSYRDKCYISVVG
ncbi:hypothetical protein ZHAS_00013159 [Anopheles sinensis]|uniref:Uncharacterized protein n=1 Tax=Anopheles sinensis TaxID=74873 RepID=A0A084W4Q2_ANOSI|nr:hypothetical protein ZHAS_00013159 [Anopheles sinensis]